MAAMKSTLFPLLFLLGAGIAAAQTPSAWRIEGIVKDAAGEPLPGARILADDSTVAIADAAGFYQLRLSSRPAGISAERVGYAQRRITIRATDFQGEVLRLDILLTLQNTLLQEVDIAVKKVEVLVKEDFKTHIFDYAVFGNYLLMLLRERKKHIVRLSSASNRIIAELEPAGRPTVLHRSCTGVFHLAGADFAQELVVQPERLDTLPRYDLSVFRSLVVPCILESRGYYFFRESGRLNQNIRYWYCEPSGAVRPLAQIVREAGEREMQAALNALRTNAPLVREPDLPPNWRGQPYDKDFDPLRPSHVTGDFGTEHLLAMAYYNHQLNHLSWLESLRLDSVYAPLIGMGDTILLFDTELGEVRRFNVGFSGAETLPLDFHRAAGWQKRLLKDAATGRLYAHFADKGVHLLKRLNPLTFQPEATYRLPQVTHLSHHYQVHNGFLYFLGRENATVPNTALFKVGIAQQPPAGK